MLAKILKQDRMFAPRIILALTTGMMLTCSAKVSFGQSAAPASIAPAAQSTATDDRRATAVLHEAPADQASGMQHAAPRSAGQ